ncbi:MAG: VCBS repeat-containing protein, partial [Phycisphaerales bacterium]
ILELCLLQGIIKATSLCVNLLLFCVPRRRIMAKDAVLFVLILLAARASNAYEPNYCRFQPHEQPPGKMIPCKSIYSNHSGGRTLRVFVADPIMIIVQRADPNGGLTASLIENGEVICGPTTLEGSAHLGVRVWAGDLTSDRDGHQDVVIATANPGNGLAASISFACFFLHTQGTYRTMDAISYNLNDNDFVDLNNDGRLEWIQTEFISDVAGRDGKAHNYWVMNLIHFRDDHPVLANAIDDHFPSWIWFTYKPNHTNTTQLSDKQKRELFENQAIGLDIYSR